MASLERAYINPDLGVPTQGMLEYIKLCCNKLPVDVDNADARIYFQKHVTIATDRLVRFPTDRVEKETMAGIPGMTLDLGIRYVAGSLHALGDHPGSPSRWSHNGLYLTEAARCANRATILKESAGVLCHTARLLSDTVKILATGKHRLNHVASICKRYLERRDRAIEESTRARALKEARASNHYKCTRNDCGIRATSQRALYKCGGPCASEVEPHYYSKECQKLAHKPYCKGREGPISTTGPLPATSVSASDASLASDSASTGSSQKKRRKQWKASNYWITMPSPDGPGEVEISTHTLDVGMIRQLGIITRRAREEGFESVIASLDVLKMAKTSD
ncbi:hypothetical protein HETIRDRAFT_430945 [Heterobasidion irregulare TC 32-1]|uniref:MYND-type domain-containing protein n=1 Tax=Heterobasidion irregulare (strain TC 32-1) TaxID=747525 RepID=W4JNJ8_HETIT|nr:uncharacterized protein HETIRDRAFT_430945 [Heterobasidion irregulare TC 32-1]ETW74640.1 hypothetical protein HETIRDRAFT_430945 [Heterobasidion irregulare TC 32-1]